MERFAVRAPSDFVKMLEDVQGFVRELSHGSATVLIIALCAVSLCLTRLYTTIEYRRAVTRSEAGSEGPLVQSPLLPHSIPWLGHTLRFLERSPRRWYHRQTLKPPHGVHALQVARRRTHVVTNAAATRYLFRHTSTGGLTRENFVGDLLGKCLLVTPHDIKVVNTGEGRKRQEDIFLKFLARREAVSELTTLFSNRLSQSFDETLSNGEKTIDIHLYSWLRKQVITASLTVFFGEQLLRVYLGICEDIFHFDEDLCSFFFGIKRFLSPSAWSRRDRILHNLMRWEALMYKLQDGPDDPASSTSWESVFGSRYNRARLRWYAEFALSPVSRAGLNLSIMFALASNVIPAIGWMLFHTLAGPDNQRLLSSVREEIDAATNVHGNIDQSILLSVSPVLQSIWTEVTRHYCDNMIMRDVTEDIGIPLDDQGIKKFQARKGDLVISPCWVAHHDPQNGHTKVDEPSLDHFVAHRFIGQNLGHTKVSALAGVPTPQMYPFGGGKSICAGRVFAREEAIVTVAQTLRAFDFKINGFVDGTGRPTSSFPGLTPSLPGVTMHVPLGDLSVTIRKRAA